MSVKVLKTLGDGHRYMKTWPMVKQLRYYFPEYRVIQATQLGLLLMPPLAIIAAGSQLYLYGWTLLPQAITIALFFVSLPLQGLLWLGWRSNHPLPLSLLDWGNTLAVKLQQLNVSCAPLGAKARYFDMAKILKMAFERLDNRHWEQL